MNMGIDAARHEKLAAYIDDLSVSDFELRRNLFDLLPDNVNISGLSTSNCNQLAAAK